MIERIFICSVDINLEEKLFMVTDPFFLFATEVEFQSFSIKNLYKNIRDGFKTSIMIIFIPKGWLPLGAPQQDLTWVWMHGQIV